MNVNGQLDRIAQGPDQIRADVWCEQPRHVLDDQAVAAHVFQFLGRGHELRNTVHRAGGVADRPLRVFTRFLDRLYRHAQIAGVVERIEYAIDIDTVVGGAMHEGAYHVVGVMAIAQYVLPSQ